jgi:hypothetical protein
MSAEKHLQKPFASDLAWCSPTLPYQGSRTYSAIREWQSATVCSTAFLSLQSSSIQPGGGAVQSDLASESRCLDEFVRQ